MAGKTTLKVLSVRQACQNVTEADGSPALITGRDVMDAYKVRVAPTPNVAEGVAAQPHLRTLVRRWTTAWA